MRLNLGSLDGTNDVFYLCREQITAIAQSLNAQKLIDQFKVIGQYGTWLVGTDQVVLENSLGHRSHVRMDSHGRIAEVVTPTGRIHSYAYDEDKKTESYKDPIGQKLQWTYDSNGRPESLSDGNDRKWLFNWDQWV